MPTFFVRRDEQSLAAYFSAYRGDQALSVEPESGPAAPVETQSGGGAAPVPLEAGEPEQGNGVRVETATDAQSGGETAPPAAPSTADFALQLFAQAEEPIGFSPPASDGVAAGVGASSGTSAASFDATAVAFETFGMAEEAPLLCATVPFDPPLSPGRVFYVDAAGGSDAHSGLSAASAFKSLAQVQSLLQDGDTVLLKCGSVFHEQLRFSASHVTVQSYGSGANPLIDGDGARHGVVIQGEMAMIRDIDVTDARNGIYVTGNDASAAVIGGNYTANGTGIVAGGGGQLILVDGAHCTGSRTALGAGDGIQISADADAGVHLIQNVVCEGNAIAGVNAKVGTVSVSDSVLSFNGEPGWIAQNYIAAFHISGSRIEGNNQSDHGVGQASIEDGAVVYSTGNLYLNPHNGAYATVQINIVTSAGWTPDRPSPTPAALYSDGDKFVNTSGQTNTVGSIQVMTGDAPTVVSLLNAVFDHAAGSGVAVRAPNATGLVLTLDSSLFDMTNSAAVIVASLENIVRGLTSSQFLRADGGTVMHAGGVSYSVDDLAALFAQYLDSGGAALPLADGAETALAAALGPVDLPFDLTQVQLAEPMALANPSDYLFT